MCGRVRLQTEAQLREETSRLTLLQPGSPGPLEEVGRGGVGTLEGVKIEGPKDSLEGECILQ